MDQTGNRLNGDGGRAILRARGLVKRFGRVVALDGADFDLLPGEVLAVIGDNGAGKSTLIKALAGAITPDAGQIFIKEREVHFHSPIEARREGIETVHQTLALAPSLSIADNLFLGREIRQKGLLGRLFRRLDRARMQREARRHLSALGLLTIQDINQAVETLSGGQRQGVAVARAAAFGSRVIIMDEPTAALGVKEFGPRTRPDSRRQPQGSAPRLGQPQHAPRVRSRRPHPYHAVRAPDRGDQPEGSFDV